jgi:hypothetical protein
MLGKTIICKSVGTLRLSVVMLTLLYSHSYGGDVDVENHSSASQKSEDVHEGATSPPSISEGQKILPKLPTTEKLLMTAMESNPDILVAKSKVRQAEAELNRTRLDVVRQILKLRALIQDQQDVVHRLRSLRPANSVSSSERQEASIKLSASEAELQYLLGNQSSKDLTK